MKAAAIRELYATGRWSQRELAEQFGVTQGKISHVVLGKSWVNSCPS